MVEGTRANDRAIADTADVSPDPTSGVTPARLWASHPVFTEQPATGQLPLDQPRYLDRYQLDSEGDRVN